MAAKSPVKDLCEEATCSICLDYFKDPVTIIECGHNFCQACLTQCWRETGTEVSCPQCRKRVQKTNFIPNRQLKNVVEIAKEFQRSASLQEERETEGKGRICEKHQEPLKLFCKNDETLICVVCVTSREHENHKIIPQEEAAQDYKKQIEAERQKTVEEFIQLRQFLDKQENLLLDQMEEVEKEIERKRDWNLTKLSFEFSCLDNMIMEMEMKCRQPANELLQDIRSTLQRCQEKKIFTNSVVFCPPLKWKVWEFCDINPFLQGIRKQFEDTLLSGIQLQKANVTLDRETANPWLILSEDGKSLKCGVNGQDLPDNPKRFITHPFVLGCEEFTAGRHYWEISVGREGNWAVGVARKSVRRKGTSTCDSKDGIWAIWKSTWSLSEGLKRIRVSLNCPGQRLTFFDADTAALLYTYSETSFSGETLLPFFNVDKKGCLTLSGITILEICIPSCLDDPCTELP
ncbi:zinc finger protein RFP-like [Hemicordylus capensis]|uniref:zinc finger protein RFP-like n=1 Tax=Hemicordylus capensis TaxID=884348 RepID=UPI0023042E61|nr:zinc finger protein RFP-like [Hemicordylus capensis]